MKPSVNALILLAGIYLFASCHTKTNSSDIITIDLNANVKDTLYYSSFIDSISYIPLQTTDSCLIGQIKDVIIRDNMIFVHDKQLHTIWIFDNEGNYKSNISRKGSGPEEYATLNKITYNNVNKQITILDIWTQSILTYDLSGHFIKRIKLDTYPTDFVKLDDTSYILSRIGEKDSLAGFYLADSSGHKTEMLIQRSQKQLFVDNFEWDFSNFDDTIAFMAPNLDNNVYHHVNGKLTKAYPIHILPSSTTEYEPGSTSFYSEDFKRTTYIENSKWIFLTYWSNKYDLRTIFYSKEQHKAFIGNVAANDIDGIRHSKKTSASNNNTFTFWLTNDDDRLNPTLQVLHLK